MIRIDQQPRPFYLKKDYGKLKKDKVYVRQGSSTDPTKPATLEEVARMGLAANVLSPEAELKVEFACAELDNVIGTKLPLSAECCDMPDPEEIPRLAARRPSGLDLSSIRMLHDTVLNKVFYHEFAYYESVKRLFRPIRLVVTNTVRTLGD